MRLLASTILMGVLFVPATSRAYSCIDESCPTWCGPIEYWIGNIPAELDEAATVSAINNAMAAWAAPDCTTLASTYLGRTTEEETTDGMSVVRFIETDWTNSATSFAVTRPRWNPAGCILEADIDLNAQDFTWTTTMPTSVSAVNVFSVVLRSAGQFYGLGSSTDPTAVMSFSNAGRLTALAADDSAGICALYPEGSPCTDGVCPMGEECVGDVCVSDPCATVTCGAEERCVAGACVADICQPCTATIDCPVSSTCIRYPGDDRYCSAACTADVDCMAGESCLVTGDERVCIRLVGGTPDCTSTAPPDAGVDASVPLDGGTDGGTSDSDAGTTSGADGGTSRNDGGTSRNDAGTTGTDAGTGADAGTTTGDDGCSCSAAGTRRHSPSALWLVAALGLTALRRRTRR